ncbi:hypothetical protein NDU88_002370 [Pleurodeles waltl]|uniref:Uncharacterized protein n=1 Tax=Pleurodeles waltl TaxID=8319 RepID=A0AAV7Q957_PLEWA|nr:hypothetical protein NDU88_002370 [Pleurodeles waltl]
MVVTFELPIFKFGARFYTSPDGVFATRRRAIIKRILLFTRGRAYLVAITMDDWVSQALRLLREAGTTCIKRCGSSRSGLLAPAQHSQIGASGEE